MKVIIAGSRTVTDIFLVGAGTRRIEKRIGKITEVVSGTARGADQLGESWADANHVPVKRFPADWTQYGKRAGIIRNEQMGAYADALVAVWDGKSRGTKHMIDFMRGLGKPVEIVRQEANA